MTFTVSTSKLVSKTESSDNFYGSVSVPNSYQKCQETKCPYVIPDVRQGD